MPTRRFAAFRARYSRGSLGRAAQLLAISSHCRPSCPALCFYFVQKQITSQEVLFTKAKARQKENQESPKNHGIRPKKSPVARQGRKSKSKVEWNRQRPCQNKRAAPQPKPAGKPSAQPVKVAAQRRDSGRSALPKLSLPPARNSPCPTGRKPRATASGSGNPTFSFKRSAAKRAAKGTEKPRHQARNTLPRPGPHGKINGSEAGRGPLLPPKNITCRSRRSRPRPPGPRYSAPNRRGNPRAG